MSVSSSLFLTRRSTSGSTRSAHRSMRGSCRCAYRYADGARQPISRRRRLDPPNPRLGDRGLALVVGAQLDLWPLRRDAHRRARVRMARAPFLAARSRCRSAVAAGGRSASLCVVMGAHRRREAVVLGKAPTRRRSCCSPTLIVLYTVGAHYAGCAGADRLWGRLRRRRWSRCARAGGRDLRRPIVIEGMFFVFPRRRAWLVGRLRAGPAH